VSICGTDSDGLSEREVHALDVFYDTGPEAPLTLEEVVAAQREDPLYRDAGTL
jgi:hypothetical protein